MGTSKKRKISRNTSKQDPQPDGNERVKLTINSWEDVADSGDEFQISRDKILLEEEPARKRRRKLEEEYDGLLPSDEEVLELPSSDEDDYIEEDANDAAVDEDASSVEDNPENEQEVEEAWGTSRKDYYNADTIETEADALEEEEEALRLQQKQLQGMTEADFGFDEVDWLANGKDIDGEEENEQLVQGTLPQIEVTDDMPAEERLRILNSRYPEFDALSKEFVLLSDQYEGLSKKAQQFSNYTQEWESETKTPGSILKWRALGAYLGVLSMYFVLLTSGSADDHGNHTTMNPIELRKHPIMETLMQARTQWEQIKSLSLPDPDPTNGHNKGTLPQPEPSSTTAATTATGKETKAKPKRASKAEVRATKAKAAADAEREARLQKTREDLARISASLKRNPTSITRRKIAATIAANTDDFGETPTETNLQDRRKKSLAFYTSQIASKSQKRNLASKGAGGDDDIPYKERFRDKMARLNAEAEARGQKSKDTLGEASDEEDTRAAAELRTQADEDDYYQTIASKTKSKKDDKVARAAALKEAAAQGAQIREVEQVGADGKRAITYAIEKNKGLTPKRKKEVRNPRVKKRLKYEEKMKKLGSIRQVYKGGEGRGGYGGEMTGIKSSIVRSRKL